MRLIQRTRKEHDSVEAIHSLRIDNKIIVLLVDLPSNFIYGSCIQLILHEEYSEYSFRSRLVPFRFRF